MPRREEENRKRRNRHQDQETPTDEEDSEGNPPKEQRGMGKVIVELRRVDQEKEQPNIKIQEVAGIH